MAVERDGLAADRVAMLVVTHPGGVRRGSGYRVAATAVLTAAHVLIGATAARVTFEVDRDDGWSTDALDWWVDAESDLAVLTIRPRDGEPVVRPARFGRIGHRPGRVPVHAAGFPRWKLRSDDAGAYRDSHHAFGTVAALSNWREGTLEVAVDAPAADPDPERSPWEGMSGSALWASDRIVGVLARHHPSDGLGRLAAARLDRAVERLGPRSEALRALVPSLPSRPDELVDVVGDPPGLRVLRAYREQVAAIAPPLLQDREPELAEIAAFCAGGSPYAWWQAGPWAGKSALLAWVVVNPPPGVDVVSFFITRRLRDQADSHAYLTAALEQLAALVGEPAPAPESAARAGHVDRLLGVAAARAAEVGRRLLLVVDGLDEDAGATGEVAGPSIAALLPKRPPPDVRVLVASRPHPPLPSDVDDDHPLRHVAPRALATSPHARDVQRVATAELALLWKGPPLQRDLLGLVAASGGGLRLADLEELTEASPFELEELIDGRLGRSVGSRPGADGADPVYLFTHDELARLAVRQLGRTLARYTDRLHGWARSYADAGWPAGTPPYLLRGYPLLLAQTGGAARLHTLALDRSRHDRMLAVTGGDALALNEVAMATDVLGRHPRPDLGALVQLALVRSALLARNAQQPANLPAVWARLGDRDRAAALVAGLADPSARAAALRSLVPVTDRTVAPDPAAAMAAAAEAAAGEVPDPAERARALADLAEVLAESGDHRSARRLIDDILRAARDIGSPVAPAELDRRTERATVIGLPLRTPGRPDPAEPLRIVRSRLAAPWGWPEVLPGVVRALAAVGDVDEARRLASNAEGRWFWTPRDDVVLQARTLVAAAAAADPGSAGQLLDAAEERIADIDHAKDRASALSEAVAPALRAGDPERARLLATAAVDAVVALDEPAARDECLPRVIGAVAAAWGVEAAERLVEEISAPATRLVASAELAREAASRGDRPGVDRLAGPVLRQIGALPAQERAGLLGHLAGSYAVAGDLDRAEQLAGDLTGDPTRQAQALAELAATAVDVDPVRATRWAVAAERLARTVTTAGAGIDDVVAVATALGSAPDVDGADRDRLRRLVAAGERLVASSVSSAVERAEVLAALAASTASAGDEVELRRLVPCVEDAVRAVQGDQGQAELLVPLVEVVANAGDRALAERLVDGTDPGDFWGRGALLVALNDRSRVAEAEESARAVLSGANERVAAAALASFVEPAAWTGDLDHAERLLGELSRLSVDDRARLRARLAEIAARSGDRSRAERLVAELAAYAWPQPAALVGLASAAAALGDHRRVRRFAASAEQHAQDSDRRDDDLGSLVVALIEAGDGERARRVAMSIADPRARAAALADLALASDDDAGRRLLAEVVSGESWRYALTAVAALDPPAVRGLADTLLQWGDHDAVDG